jgi:nitrogen regulatory protein PII-like uncharacterized protein
MSNNNKEQYDIYTIPYNFIDESTLFGGSVKTRFFIEGCLLGTIVWFIVKSTILTFFSLSFKYYSTIFLISIGGGILIGCLGFNGDPISRFLINFVKFRKNKRILYFNGRIKLHKRESDDIEIPELPRDRLLKLFNSLGNKRESTAEEDKIEEFVFEDDLKDFKKIKISKDLGKDVSDNFTSTTADEKDIYDYIQNFENIVLSPIEDEYSPDYDSDEEILATINEGDIVEDVEESIVLSERDFYLEETKGWDEYGEIETIVIDDEDIKQSIAYINDKPNDSVWVCKMCGEENYGKYCSECGAKKD